MPPLGDFVKVKMWCHGKIASGKGRRITPKEGNGCVRRTSSIGPGVSENVSRHDRFLLFGAKQHPKECCLIWTTA
jgi:hypothetical protein